MMIEQQNSFKHVPVNYVCLFCCLVKNIKCDHNQLRHSDIICQNEVGTAFMATRRFPNNQDHVLVIPNQHFENIFDLPLELAAEIHAFARNIALAMKATYRCDGILIRQHNEPAGGQNIFHYHMHVIPRYTGDNFDFSQKLPFPADKRAKVARSLRNYISANT